MLATTCSCRRLWVSKLLQQQGVELRQVIIDEAGTTTEPEVLCPLTLSQHAKHVVLVGDHRQLQPVVKNRDAAALGLARSCFERLALREESTNKTEVKASTPSSREDLLKAAFGFLDKRATGRLTDKDLREFAEFTGFGGGSAAWLEEYNELCRSLGCDESEGLDLECFRNLVDDSSEEGCYCSDAELAELAGVGGSFLGGSPETVSTKVPAAVMLRQQYRMHPSLNSFPSEQFYGGLVGSDASTRQRPAGILAHPRTSQHCATMFWPSPTSFSEEVHEVASRDASTRSKANPHEAERCVQLASALVGRVGAKGVAVLSWYNAQIAEFRDRLRSHPGCSGLHVGSVVTAQGSEWDYVLLSTVRNAETSEQTRRSKPKVHLGCLADRHLLNVAVTRGRLGIVVLGSALVLSSNRHWSAFLQHCKASGGLLLADEQPQLLTAQQQQHSLLNQRAQQETETAVDVGHRDQSAHKKNRS